MLAPASGGESADGAAAKPEASVAASVEDDTKVASVVRRRRDGDPHVSDALLIVITGSDDRRAGDMDVSCPTRCGSLGNAPKRGYTCEHEQPKQRPGTTSAQPEA
jgi:hypothetical protein